MNLEESLLFWYRSNRRHMPWRENPTPYHVYLSEIMLQQTQVETVKSFYLRFLKRFPTIQTLANAKEEEVLKLWEGLGYYSRGRNLRKSALVILNDYQGNIPSNKEDLLSLPGIGPYTSRAISAIAFHQKEIAVDGNLIRVFSRLEEISEKNPEKMKILCEGFFLKELIREDPSQFNQALMDIGEMICLPRGTPLCETCPLASFCKARKDGTASLYPPAKKEIEKKTEKLTVLLLVNRGKIAIRQRQASGLLASLYEFPTWEGTMTEDEVRKKLKTEGYVLVAIKDLGQTKHVFSHLIWEMRGFQIEIAKIPSSDHFLWATTEALLSQYSIPSAFSFYKRKYLAKVPKKKKER